jgi:2-methylcitrate dehydratase PrpD
MSDLSDPSCAARLARFATQLRDAPPPPEALEAAKCSLLDAFGCGMAAVTLGEGAPAIEWFRRRYGDSAPLRARPGVPPADVALVTGNLIHALDFDDTHPESMCHVTAVVGTAAVAVGQALGSTGAAVLGAQIAGVETVARLGAVASGRWHERGIHPTAACGVFGATVAAGSLMGLDAPTLTRALGIAGSTSSGLFEYLADGSQTKPFHAGWAAHAGILAAELAACGLRGPTTVIEGRFGLFGALLGEDHAAGITARLDDLGEVWETTRNAIKPYPTCHFTHAAIEAAGRLLDDGVCADEVTWMTVGVPRASVGVVLEPRAAKVAPRTAYDAKFSLPFCVGAMLSDGRVDLASFAEERLADPAVLRFAAASDHIVQERSAQTPFFTELRLRLADGSERSLDVPRPLGTPGRAIGRDGVVDKFAANARPAITDPDGFAAAVLALEHAPEVSALTLPTARVGAQPTLQSLVGSGNASTTSGASRR